MHRTRYTLPHLAALAALLMLIVLTAWPLYPTHGATAPVLPPTPPSIYSKMPRINPGAIRPNAFAAKPANTPDLDVQYIARTPCYKWCWQGIQSCTGVKL
jgi:hypothetical protein